MSSLRPKTIHPRMLEFLVRQGAFRTSPLAVIDVGVKGGFERHWVHFKDQVRLIGFEANAEEHERLRAHSAEQEPGRQYYPYALASSSGKKSFHINISHPASSSFFAPNTAFLRRLPIEVNFAEEKIVDVRAVDLDSFSKAEQFPPVDFIKLDVEGGELDVLRGAERVLKNEVLGFTAEVEFAPVYLGASLFADVDSFARSLGFALFDLGFYRFARKSLSLTPALSPLGQVVAGHALYLRDGVAEMQAASNAFSRGWGLESILKLASLMEIFGLPDCAIELLQYGGASGCMGDVDVTPLIDRLTPLVRGRQVSYKEYCHYLVQTQARRERPAGIPKRLYRKIVPESLRRMIHTVRARKSTVRPFSTKL